MTTLSASRIHHWISHGVLGDTHQLVGTGHRRQPWTEREHRALAALARVSTDFQELGGATGLGAPTWVLAELWRQFMVEGNDVTAVKVGTITIVARLA